MLNKNLYVRVKRSRDEEPAESLCIVEDSAPAKKRSIKTLEAQLSNLSAISAPVSEPKRLHLSRVRTLSCADDNMLTETSMQERGHVEPPRKKRVAARIVVTSGSKTVIPESESQQPYIVIDMAQMARKSSTVTSVTSAVSTTTAAEAATSSPARITARILDPASRLLDRGITTAMKSGDFNDISSALMQGANPDHQNINGFTALMVAAQHCNIRMVKRLLMKSVDVTKENHNHQTALDLINTNIRNKADSIEIQNLLQNAVLKSQQTAQRQATILRENIRQTALMSNKEETIKDGEEGEYVYDIYCVNTDNSDTIMETVENTTTPPTTTTEQDSTTTTNTTPTSTSLNTDPLYSIVRVEGLRILDSEHIELHMAYDSDWSDLGDDEEPDSNDERFHGNDYPEDEENEGQELRDDSSVEEQPKRRAVARRGGGNKLNTTATTSRSYSTSILPTTTVLRNTTTSTTTGRKVAFAGDTEDGEVNFDELLQQEEAEEDSEEHSGEDSWKGEEDSDMEEEAALYRQLDGDYTEYYDSNTVGDTIQREGENSDYDLEADEETERRLYHTQQQQQNRAAAASSSSGTSSTMSHKKKASSHGKKSTNPSANTTTNTATTTTSTIKPSHKLSSYKDLLYDDDVNLPQFDRKFGIGKVLRPQLLRGPYSHTTTTSSSNGTTASEFSSSGLYQEVHTTESLQELWDEPPIEHTSTTTATTSNSMCTINNTTNNSGNDMSKEHSDRLHDMRSRTGMTFASSIREFDIHTGLAKYGVELSDDEQDHIDSVSEKYTLYPSVVGSNMANNRKQSSYNTTNTTTGTSNITTSSTSSSTTQLKYETIKPSLNTIAYDSELDHSD